MDRPKCAKRRELTYITGQNLSRGDVFRFFAAAADTGGNQQFSIHYVGASVTGFSVRYIGTYNVWTPYSTFGAASAGRVMLYSIGGGYTDNGYTAPTAGAYQLHTRNERQSL